MLLNILFPMMLVFSKSIILAHRGDFCWPVIIEIVEGKQQHTMWNTYNYLTVVICCLPLAMSASIDGGKQDYWLTGAS